MKKLLIILLFILIGCSNETHTETTDAGGVQINLTDTSTDAFNFDTAEVDSNEEYGCAKVFVQIPYENLNNDAGISHIMYSHKLWSIPVRRTIGTERWIAFDSGRSLLIPELGNADFSIDEDNTIYAIVITPNGTELIDQEVRPELIGEWEVCEEYSCGADGCQSHPEFSSSEWACYSTNSIDKCACTFNDNKFSHCLVED